MVHRHLVLFHVEGDVRHVQEVIGEVFLDQVALVAAADDELGDTVEGIALHDVPENRTSTDLDHRFGSHRGLFREPCAKATGQNDCFHRMS